MATKVQYLDLTGLTKYDELIKQYIGEGDAKSYKVVRLSGQKLQFFKSENPGAEAVPDTEITLTQQDVSNFIQKVTGATAGNFASLNADGTIADSGSKPSDFAQDSKVDDLDDLTTTAKTSVVAAINEVKEAADDAATDSVVTIEQGTASSGAAKTYIVKQGDAQIGTIDIPKDMVVSSGTVEKKETSGEWGEAGTYIVLTIANATNDTLYIPATSLVDIYTAQQSAAQVQLTITNNVISATIVDGSVDAAALADNAVTTAKIAAQNVTLEKLSTAVQTSLGKADTALQPDEVAAISTSDIEALFA